MAANGTARENGQANGHHDESSLQGTFRVKAGLAQMLKGGVIMGKTPPHVVWFPGLFLEW